MNEEVQRDEENYDWEVAPFAQEGQISFLIYKDEGELKGGWFEYCNGQWVEVPE